MAKQGISHDGFAERRRKEAFAFLVVKFLKAFDAFARIHEGFRAASAAHCLAGCGLFEQVKELEESLAFDLKEKAHALYRAPAARRPARPSPRDMKRQLAELKAHIETKSLDSLIGTGYHFLMILREALYQIERYSPAFEKEQEEIGRVEALAQAVGYSFNPAERDEMERIRALGGISAELEDDSRDLAARMVELCRSLFDRSAQTIRHIMADVGDNEILVLNLLQNQALLERVYGKDSAEGIFSAICSGRAFTGRTGLERARAFVRGHCGNLSATPAS
jgi:hypothetical protein